MTTILINTRQEKRCQKQFSKAIIYMACIIVGMGSTGFVEAENFFDKLISKTKELNRSQQTSRGSTNQNQSGGSTNQNQSGGGEMKQADVAKLFIIQGITTGMSKKDAAVKLKASGWQVADRGGMGRVWVKNSDTKNKQLAIEYGKMGNEIQVANLKYSIGFLTPNYDPDLLQKQLLTKYGKPHDTKYTGLMYWQYPNAPDRQEITLTCRDEMTARGMPAYQARGKAQVAGNVQEWVNSGDAKVRENCPRSLGHWKRFMQKAFGKRLHITVLRSHPGTTGGGVTFELREDRIKYDYQRQLVLQKEEARRTAPKASMDNSDF